MDADETFLEVAQRVQGGRVRLSREEVVAMAGKSMLTRVEGRFVRVSFPASNAEPVIELLGKTRCDICKGTGDRGGGWRCPICYGAGVLMSETKPRVVVKVTVTP